MPKTLRQMGRHAHTHTTTVVMQMYGKGWTNFLLLKIHNEWTKFREKNQPSRKFYVILTFHLSLATDAATKETKRNEQKQKKILCKCIWYFLVCF